MSVAVSPPTLSPVEPIYAGKSAVLHHPPNQLTSQEALACTLTQACTDWPQASARILNVDVSASGYLFGDLMDLVARFKRNGTA
mmetsp:Transcript_107188/g.184896  ORF Transcript_107188/g.184896 Transcript_107188/m.184896 type:complete len:84 (+) Transcript_107188:567-818(+)